MCYLKGIKNNSIMFKELKNDIIKVKEKILKQKEYDLVF